ncbi:MAG: hypothetical protein IJ555_10875 [Ruminococcus sp.]|nr:hypothetical protein [Ruminococcus sp.]
MKKRIISALSALVMMLSLMAVLPASALDNLSGLKINGSGKYIYILG